jgi:ecdysteroid 2-hydroxylase
MLGAAFEATARTRLAPLITRFAIINQNIFEYTSQLYGIPPQLAERLQLKAWTGFVEAVVGTMELANEILNDFQKRSYYGDGLLRQMRASGISDDNVSRIFVDFLLAAGDTSSYATQWALYSLAKDTRVQQEVRQGIQTEGGAMESALVRATVRETLRMYPVAPFIGRVLMTESVIGHYRVPPVVSVFHVKTNSVILLFSHLRRSLFFPCTRPVVIPTISPSPTISCPRGGCAAKYLQNWTR